ncbi:hypothetical protein [Clostridium sp. LP20]|uniref:hypothetical protein n=1 Tax=Clostridium sp. LP20 TaxID=3418665 RepID=UPI003EE42909
MLYIKLLAMFVSAYGSISLLTPHEVKIKRGIKKRFRHFFKDKKIINVEEKTPYIDNVELYNWGFKSTIDISRISSFDDIEKNEDYIKQLFRAKEVKITNAKGTAILEVINKEVGDVKYTYVKLPPTSLLVGYNNKGEEIIVDMKKTPHIGVQGASNSGKSKMVELALRNLKNVDIILLNVFEDDFVTIKGRRINGNEDILDYLKTIIDEPYIRDKPLYLVLDELNVLGKDKAINKAIMDVLSQARHFNIYLIALGQSLLKEYCPYKQLFNVRITFRAIDKSSISAFLGCPGQDSELLQREFICYSDSIYRGKSYLL